MKYDWTRGEAWGKTLAVLLASTLVYAAFNVFCGVCLPVERSTAVMVGILAGFPVWVVVMCYSVLTRSALRAWLVPLALTLVLAGCAWWGLATG